MKISFLVLNVLLIIICYLRYLCFFLVFFVWIMSSVLIFCMSCLLEVKWISGYVSWSMSLSFATKIDCTYRVNTLAIFFSFHVPGKKAHQGRWRSWRWYLYSWSPNSCFKCSSCWPSHWVWLESKFGSPKINSLSFHYFIFWADFETMGTLQETVQGRN